MQQYLSGEKVILSLKKDAEAGFEFVLPEYLPGISRIVKTCVCTEKVSVRNEENSIFLDLLLKIGIIYISDFGGKIKNAVFNEAFSVEFSDKSEYDRDAVYIPSAFIYSAASNPVTARKISTAISVHSSVTALKEIHTPVFDGSEHEKICVQKKELNICRKTTLPEEFFKFESEIQIDPSKPGIGEIIYADAVLNSVSCHAEEEKLSFEGKFMLHIMYEIYSEDTNSAEYAVVTAPVTVNEIINNDKISKDSQAFIYLEPLLVEPTVSFDSYGETRVISFTLKYSASPVIYNGTTLEIITDAFSEEYESLPSLGTAETTSMKNTVCDTLHITQNLSADIGNLSHISDCFVKIISVSLEHTDGKYFAFAKCLAEIFGTNTAGEFSSLNTSVNLHIPISEASYDGCVPDVFVYVKNCSAAIREGSIVCDFDTEVCGAILNSRKVTFMTDLSVDTENPVNSGKGKITVCYPAQQSSLWEIAKKYRANPEKIMQANHLENDDISSKHVLLIP